MKFAGVLLATVTQAVLLNKRGAYALPEEQGMVMWHVAPDYGELDPSVINRANGLDHP